MGYIQHGVRQDHMGQLPGAQLSPSVALETGPNQPTTLWQLTYFAFPPTEVSEGRRIKVKLTPDKHPVEARSIRFELAIGEQRLVYAIG